MLPATVLFSIVAFLTIHDVSVYIKWGSALAESSTPQVPRECDIPDGQRATISDRPPEERPHTPVYTLRPALRQTSLPGLEDLCADWCVHWVKSFL